MTTWAEFAVAAPGIAEVFTRRHRATGNLCLLATLRADGFPRISPMEPHFHAGRLWLPGMPGSTKFRDLDRDPRFCLHSATVDTRVTDGDAKLWGLARGITDPAVRGQFVAALHRDTGLDLRGEEFDLFDTDITGASAVAVGGGGGGDHLDITVWKPGEPERVVRKH